MGRTAPRYRLRLISLQTVDCLSMPKQTRLPDLIEDKKNTMSLCGRGKEERDSLSTISSLPTFRDWNADHAVCY
jgi:hypothetical protein